MTLRPWLGKYARMTAEYESANVPGLYFAGTLAHGPDRRGRWGHFADCGAVSCPYRNRSDSPRKRENLVRHNESTALV
jgi:hypothetical protein